ncbi:hypothetical protein BDZ88DRAFT_432552 [Geranomyces variabilis]|nr:hypothetical protein BDZ88DRAFT_432552 [Geranomyces variabilis]KAJ3136137.1 hypothetical protein HDU90_003540 [Geranomyces variabilis]
MSSTGDNVPPGEHPGAPDYSKTTALIFLGIEVVLFLLTAVSAQVVRRTVVHYCVFFYSAVRIAAFGVRYYITQGHWDKTLALIESITLAVGYFTLFLAISFLINIWTERLSGLSGVRFADGRQRQGRMLTTASIAVMTTGAVLAVENPDQNTHKYLTYAGIAGLLVVLLFTLMLPVWRRIQQVSHLRKASYGLSSEVGLGYLLIFMCLLLAVRMAYSLYVVSNVPSELLLYVWSIVPEIIVGYLLVFPVILRMFLRDPRAGSSVTQLNV